MGWFANIISGRQNTPVKLTKKDSSQTIQIAILLRFFWVTNSLLVSKLQNSGSKFSLSEHNLETIPKIRSEIAKIYVVENNYRCGAR